MASLNIVNDVDRHVLTSLDDVKAVVDIVDDVDRHRCRCRQVSEPPISDIIPIILLDLAGFKHIPNLFSVFEARDPVHWVQKAGQWGSKSAFAG